MLLYVSRHPTARPEPAHFAGKGMGWIMFYLPAKCLRQIPLSAADNGRSD